MKDVARARASHLPHKKALKRRMKDLGFRFYFDESRVVSGLCAAITEARCDQGISRGLLARRVSIAESVIARLENGNQGRMPSLDLLRRIAAALNLRLVVGFEKKRVVTGLRFRTI